jgi:2-polyprenyl-3-methyl-5-hydroxy-6-metoxy-1,4-benzoquinol methylase
MNTNSENFDVNKLLEYVKCNLCGVDNFTVKRKAQYKSNLSLEDFLSFYSSSSETKLLDQLVECNNCKLQYVNPRIIESVVSKGYTQAIDQRHHEQDEYRKKSFRRALKKIGLDQSNFSGGEFRLLDVGCAGGAFLRTISEFGVSCVGLELSNYLVNWCREIHGLEVIDSTIENFQKSNLKFDMITFWDVLEHVPDPNSALASARDMLNENGLLILNLPMIDTFPARILGFKWPFYLNVHLFYFEKKTIKELLNLHGFQVVKIKSYWQSLPLGYLAMRSGINVGASFSHHLKLSIRYYLGQRTLVARKY